MATRPHSRGDSRARLGTKLPKTRAAPDPTLLTEKEYFHNRKTSVLLHREVAQRGMGQHRHDFFEIAVVLSGSGVHVTGSFRHRLKTGDVLLINTQRAHGFERTRGLNLFNILIRKQLLARVGRELKDVRGFAVLFEREDRPSGRHEYPARLRLTTAELEQVEDLANRLEEETRQEARGGSLLAEAYLTLMIGLFVRSFDRNTPAAPETAAGEQGRFASLLTWVEARLERRLSVEQMARFTGTSTRTFHRHFKAALGVTPTEYVLQARTRRARDYLRQPKAEWRIGEIAQACGFEDSNYFTRFFRERTGRAPTTFRKTAKAKAE